MLAMPRLRAAAVLRRRAAVHACLARRRPRLLPLRQSLRCFASASPIPPDASGGGTGEAATLAATASAPTAAGGAKSYSSVAGRATPRSKEKFVCRVQVVEARDLVDGPAEEAAAFDFLNPFAGGDRIDPIARLRVGRVDDLETALRKEVIAADDGGDETDGADDQDDQTADGGGGGSDADGGGGDGDKVEMATAWRSEETFYFEYDRSMDVQVRLWNRVGGFSLGGFTNSGGEFEGGGGLSHVAGAGGGRTSVGPGGNKRVCLGQVRVNLSKLFDGRRGTSVDDWFPIRATRGTVADEVEQGDDSDIAAAESGMQHTYILASDDEEEDEEAAAAAAAAAGGGEEEDSDDGGSGDTAATGADARRRRQDGTAGQQQQVPVASLTQAQRQRLQEEEDAAWEGGEGSQHHSNTWLGLRKLFVSRPPARPGAHGSDLATAAAAAVVEPASGGTAPDGEPVRTLPDGARLHLRVDVIPESEVGRQHLVHPQPLGKDYAPPERRLMERIHDFVVPGARGRKFRMLSLDGGGMRGIFVSVVLQRLVQRFPTFLQEVDLIAGTSTGAILAALLASGYPPSSCTAIYRRHLAEVFNSETARRMRRLFNAQYSPTARLQLMERYIGDRTLSDLSKYVAITAFKLDGRKGTDETFFPSKTWRPALFSNLPKAGGRIGPDVNLRVVDAVMRSSAAPTYFPTYQGYVDGGVFANNPSLVTLARVVEQFPELNPTHEMLVLSMGAGDIEYNLDMDANPNADWGLQQWGPKLVDLLMSAPPMQVDLVMRTLVKENYHRFDTMLPQEHMGLDNVKSMDAIIEHAHSVDLTAVKAFLRDKMELTESFQG